jgi:uncharacterized protein
MKTVALRIFALIALCAVNTTASADLKDGALAYSRGNFAVAIQQLRPLADEGNATAQYLLGSALVNATPPLADLGEGEAWLKKSAEHGNLAAMRDLGKLNAFGKRPAERAQATQWLRAGADRGDAESQHLLGLLLLDADGADRKPAEAYMWLALAAERGHVLSGVILIEAKDKFSDQDRLQGQQLAAAWKPVR